MVSFPFFGGLLQQSVIPAGDTVAFYDGAAGCFQNHGHLVAVGHLQLVVGVILSVAAIRALGKEHLRNPKILLRLLLPAIAHIAGDFQNLYAVVRLLNQMPLKSRVLAVLRNLLRIVVHTHEGEIFRVQIRDD